MTTDPNKPDQKRGEQQPDSPAVKQSARSTAREGHHSDDADRTSRDADVKHLGTKARDVQTKAAKAIARAPLTRLDQENAVHCGADACADNADSKATLSLSRRDLAILTLLAAQQLNMRVDITP